jgi:hypothetical protein
MANPGTCAINVLIFGKPAATTMTIMMMSNGDEPGCNGGVMSGMFIGPAQASHFGRTNPNWLPLILSRPRSDAPDGVRSYPSLSASLFLATKTEVGNAPCAVDKPALTRASTHRGEPEHSSRQKIESEALQVNAIEIRGSRESSQDAALSLESRRTIL